MKNGASLEFDGKLARDSVNESLSEIVLLSNTRPIGPWATPDVSSDTAVNSSTPAPMSTAPRGSKVL